VDGYYWNGSGWTQFTNDLTTTGFLAALVAHFQYLLFELDGNDQGLRNDLDGNFRVTGFVDVAAVPEPTVLWLMTSGAAVLMLGQRRT